MPDRLSGPVLSAVVDERVRRLHDALGRVRDPDLRSLRPKVTTITTGEGTLTTVWLSGRPPGEEDPTALNDAFMLVENIGTLRDHLKKWCEDNGKPFEGDELLRSHRDAGLIQDLWNTNKHVDLDRKPRTTHYPKLVNVLRCLSISSPEPAAFGLNTNKRTGDVSLEVESGAGVSSTISGQVVDQHGNLLGEFVEVCQSAAAAWEGALVRAGVVVPPRP